MSNPFDATASMLGYLYQCRVALLDALRRARVTGSFTVAIETLDDVVFDAVGTPKELLQLKHHQDRAGNLTDASSDIWKSLRIWSEGTRTGRWPDDTRFYLVTTSATADGSAARMLEVSDQRDPAGARAVLDAVAQSSESEANKTSYSAYQALRADERLALLERVVVLPGQSDIFDVDADLRHELVHAVTRERVPAFVERLEGWWFQRVLGHLKRLPSEAIRSEELDAKMEELRAQFRDDNLPIDPDLMSVDVDAAHFIGHVFVRQLQLIDLKSRRLLSAMRQYYRASEQRSRWLREGFLLVGELNRYDQRLGEEWQLRFDQMGEELGGAATDVVMLEAARDLYRWAEQDAVFAIRRAVDEPFVTRGSLQILADQQRVGWHPHFLDRLNALLGEEA